MNCSIFFLFFLQKIADPGSVHLPLSPLRLSDTGAAGEAGAGLSKTPADRERTYKPRILSEWVAVCAPPSEGKQWRQPGSYDKAKNVVMTYLGRSFVC